MDRSLARSLDHWSNACSIAQQLGPSLDGLIEHVLLEQGKWSTKHVPWFIDHVVRALERTLLFIDYVVWSIDRVPLEQVR